MGKKKENKYTIKEILEFFENNGVLLVDDESIGEVELPFVDPEWIMDCDIEGNITS